MPPAEIAGRFFVCYESRSRVSALKILERDSSMMVQKIYTIMTAKIEYGIRYGLSWNEGNLKILCHRIYTLKLFS